MRRMILVGMCLLPFVIGCDELITVGDAPMADGVAPDSVTDGGQATPGETVTDSANVEGAADPETVSTEAAPTDAVPVVMPEAQLSTVKPLDGASLTSRVNSQLDAEKKVADILRAEFERFPGACLQVTIGDPTVAALDETSVELTFPLRFGVDHDAYRTFAEKLQPVLEEMALANGKFTSQFVLAKEKDAVGNSLVERYRWSYLKDPSIQFAAWMPEAFSGETTAFRLPMLKSDKATVAMVSEFSENLDRLDWNYFVLEPTTRGILFDVASAECYARLTLLGDDNQVLREDEFPIKELIDLRMFTLMTAYAGGASALGGGGIRQIEWPLTSPTATSQLVPSMYLIAPTFVELSKDFTHRPDAGISRRIALLKDDVNALRNVKCEMFFVREPSINY